MKKQRSQQPQCSRTSEMVSRILDQTNDRIRQRGWPNVTEQERDAANVHAFYGAVKNGGIDSVFFNSPYLGDMADELLASLERVGAVRAAAVFKQAIACFPRGRIPQTLDARVECLRRSRNTDLFGDLSRRFFREAEREEDILNAFFDQHPRAFTSGDG